MGIMRKEIVTRQKAAFEQKLKDRLAFLAGKGIKAPRTDRDPIIKNLKAEIRAVNRRLARIAEIGKRTEEMARIKAERAAAPKKEKGEGKAEKPKAAAAEGKAKKPKAEGAKGEGKGEAKAPKKKPEEAKPAPAAPAKPQE
jgi:hypothetical protein